MCAAGCITFFNYHQLMNYDHDLHSTHVHLPLSFVQIELGPSEFLTAVYGTTGPFSDSPSDVVTSLTFVSNAHIYGPLGRGGGVPFQVPMQGNGSCSDLGPFAPLVRVCFGDK
jgi:hypothetical protein